MNSITQVTSTEEGTYNMDDNNNVDRRYPLTVNKHYVYTDSGKAAGTTVFWSLPECNGNTSGPSLVSGDTIIIENMTSNPIVVVGRSTAGKVIEETAQLGSTVGASRIQIHPSSQVRLRYVATSSGSLGQNGKWLLAWMPNAEIIPPANSTDNDAYVNSTLIWEKASNAYLGTTGRFTLQGKNSSVLQVRGDGTNKGTLKILNADNSKFTSFTSANTADAEYTLPTEMGTANELLRLSSVSGTGGALESVSYTHLRAHET